MFLYHPLVGVEPLDSEGLKAKLEPELAPIVDAATRFAQLRMAIEQEIRDAQLRLRAWPASVVAGESWQRVARSLTRADMLRALLAVDPQGVKRTLFDLRGEQGGAAGFGPAAQELTDSLASAPPKTVLKVERLFGQSATLTSLMEPNERISLAQLLQTTDAISSLAPLVATFVRGGQTLGEAKRDLQANLSRHATKPRVLQGLAEGPDVLVDRHGLIEKLEMAIAESPGVILKVNPNDAGALNILLSAWRSWRALEPPTELPHLQVGEAKVHRVGNVLYPGAPPQVLDCVGNESSMTLLSTKGSEHGWRQLRRELKSEFRAQVRSVLADPGQSRMLLVLVHEDVGPLAKHVPATQKFKQLHVPKFELEDRLLSWMSTAAWRDVFALRSVRENKQSDPKHAVQLALAEMLKVFFTRGGEEDWVHACTEELWARGGRTESTIGLVRRLLSHDRSIPKHWANLIGDSKLELAELLRFMLPLMVR